MRMPNSAIEGTVWMTLSVPSTPGRKRGTRWHRMPSGSVDAPMPDGVEAFVVEGFGEAVLAASARSCRATS